MVNQSTINVAQVFGGSVNTTDVQPEIAVSVCRADSLSKHPGKPLPLGRSPRALRRFERRPAGGVYSAGIDAESTAWRMHPATGGGAAHYASELPARAWASLVAARSA
ncbi:MAG: hypothetical protein DWQ41_10825 [Planctomycetota bacterium]|nr:MAG: hypothetical protein DWQ41_10825 [Planctomycetota bacterium]